MALVAKAHERGVVHRDLKPDNFLVSEDGKVFLADFGLAKTGAEPEQEVERMAFHEYASGHVTQTSAGMGTPLYMPPEQYEDFRSADGRADVYALGVMLFKP